MNAAGEKEGEKTGPVMVVVVFLILLLPCEDVWMG